MRMEFDVSSGFAQADQVEPVLGVPSGLDAGVVRPRQVEEGITEVVGADAVPAAAAAVGHHRDHLRQRQFGARHNQLVQVDHEQILAVEHVPVEAVVERGEDALRPDLFLRGHVQLPPRQHVHQALVGVAPQDAVHLVADRVVVEGEVGHAQQPVDLDEFNQLANPVEAVMKRLDADGQLVFRSLAPTLI